MAVPVFVLYTGIVSFVPEPKSSSYNVVAQNAQDTQAPHLSYIVLPKDASVPEGTLEPPPFDNVDDSDVESGFVAYLLNGWEISFDNHVVSPPLTTKPGFLQHVLRLSEGCHPAYPSCDRIDGIYLRTQDPNLVAARMSLTHGVLDVWLEKDNYEWQFKDWGSPWRVLTQTVIYLLEIEFDEADMERTVNLRFTGEKKTFTVKLPARGAALLIGNTLKNKAEDKPEPYDHHVTMYYDLASVAYPSAFRRHLIRRDAPRLTYAPQRTLFKEQPAARALLDILIEILKVGGANCPPARWSG